MFAPAAPAAGKGRAVLFWIYGGALQFGYGSQPFYDGSHFAAYEDVIVVTPNYRTNGMSLSPSKSSKVNVDFPSIRLPQLSRNPSSAT